MYYATVCFNGHYANGLTGFLFVVALTLELATCEEGGAVIVSSADDSFSIPAFVICVRESMEGCVIAAVLLNALHKSGQVSPEMLSLSRARALSLLHKHSISRTSVASQTINSLIIVTLIVHQHHPSHILNAMHACTAKTSHHTHAVHKLTRLRSLDLALRLSHTYSHSRALSLTYMYQKIHAQHKLSVFF